MSIIPPRKDQGKAYPPDDDVYDRRVEMTLRMFLRAHGPHGAEVLLRKHIPYWPEGAREALARIARKGGAL